MLYMMYEIVIYISGHRAVNMGIFKVIAMPREWLLGHLFPRMEWGSIRDISLRSALVLLVTCDV